MKLIVTGSSSKGNNYILQSSRETLLIEAGVRWKEVQRALDYKVSNIVGAIITHEHGDHAKYINEYLDAGIDTYSSSGTIEALSIKSNRFPKVLDSGVIKNIGKFKIYPFDIIHDAKEPLGFLIYHPEMGNTLFLTDTHYSRYKFKNLNHIIVECNYDRQIVERKVIEGSMHPSLYKRITKSHMHIDTVLQLLADNDISKVNNIILIHLSDGNSDEKEFKKRVQQATGKNTVIADKGVKVNLSLNPF